jgi:glycosyltransferase involved in cell wall biosynthesis
LHLYVVAQEGAGTAYLRELKHLAAVDRRIVFHEPVGNERVTEVLRDCDVLAVPSRLLETGPLVVLEAFVAGLPVLGSNLGGVAELVRHEGDGLLVEPDSVEAWREGLLRLVREPGLLGRLRSGVRPPRRMSAVADEMLQLYTALLEEKATSSGTRLVGIADALR